MRSLESAPVSSSRTSRSVAAQLALSCPALFVAAGLLLWLSDVNRGNGRGLRGVGQRSLRLLLPEPPANVPKPRRAARSLRSHLHILRCRASRFPRHRSGFGKRSSRTFTTRGEGSVADVPGSLGPDREMAPGWVHSKRNVVLSAPSFHCRSSTKKSLRAVICRPRPDPLLPGRENPSSSF